MATTAVTGRLLFALGAFATTSLYHLGIRVSRDDKPPIERTPEAELDRIIHLPGLPMLAKLNFEQFGGYLDAAETRHVYYWYVESESNPDEDPVVLWTNGGPGCSGLLGFGAEHGPFTMDGYGRLQRTHFNWNRVANMLYVEQPAGVGFSYTDSPQDKITGDEQAAADNFRLVLDFFRKFPERRSNEFYIASESYGGHYMPQLALEILGRDSEKTINFRGFMVGNPFVDPYSNTMTQFRSYYSHGLLAKPLFDKWEKQCTSRETYLSEHCETITDEMFEQFKGDANINPYALDYPVCHESFESLEERDYRSTFDVRSLDDSSKGYTSSAQQDTLLNRTGSANLPSQERYKPCSQVNLEYYLNDHKVRTALHVLDRASYKWSPCGGVDYSKDDVNTPVISLYQELVDRGVRGEHSLKILIFSGDNDSICATEGTQDWIWSLGRNASSMWKTWKANDQTSGFVTEFDMGEHTNATFTFVTVHGAGHEVPAYKPLEALTLFQRYLDGEW